MLFQRYIKLRAVNREIIRSVIQLSFWNRKSRGVDRTRYIGPGISLPFYFIHRTTFLFLVESVTRPRPTNTTTIIGERPPSSTPPTSPTPSSPSRPASTLNSPHFPRFITCHHRPARAIYIYLPTVARLG